jgi:4-alpha-glucanotransferase
MKITFTIRCHTEWGQQLSVAGSRPELGEWDTAKAARMNYFPGDRWETELTFPDGEGLSFEYRYIIRQARGNLLWEGGDNRRFSLPLPGGDGGRVTGRVELRDVWRRPSDPESVLLTSAFCDVIFKRETHPTPASACPRARTVLRVQVAASRIADKHVLCVAGNIPALGSWDVSKAPRMRDDEFPLWTLDIPLRGNEGPVSYKYLIMDNDGALVRYEEGHDRVLEVGGVDGKSAGRRLIVVTDSGVRYPSRWRGAGIVIPVFSLRSARGLGTGEFLDLKPLVDWARSAGFQMIQLLPVNDTSVHMDWRDSFPYHNLSVFALHPLYLNLPAIGRLPETVLREIESLREKLSENDRLNYAEVMEAKRRLLKQIFRVKKTEFLSSPGFRAFLRENAFWLEPYAAFCYLRDLHGTSDYTTWGRHRSVTEADVRALVDPGASHYSEIALHYFTQYHLHLQLREASEYAARNRVVLKGDIPIGVARRSVCTWRSPGLFHMDRSAGAPPDPFADDGQNWGFPTYNWDAMSRDNYLWWRSRLQQMAGYFQMVRLDHVLGFFRIWEIPVHSVSGLMGRFNPAIPISKGELEGRGITDVDRLCAPYITAQLLHMLFGPDADAVAAAFLEECAPRRFLMKPAFMTQRQVWAHCALPGAEPPAAGLTLEKLRAGLFTLIADIILFRDEREGVSGFHPRVNMMATYSYACLEGRAKDALKELYYDYFYRRQEDLWQREGMARLPVLKSASTMLVCGEDLGMIPECVPRVMEELCLLGVRIQRMPRETGREFSHPRDYSYLTVCSPSTHDMSTIRGWWEEDRARAQRFSRTILGHAGEPPQICEPRICEEIIGQHLESPSMWAVFPLQDILGMSGSLRRPGDPRDEQINVPGDPAHRWEFRLHVSLEELIARQDFSARVLRMVAASGRHQAY